MDFQSAKSFRKLRLRAFQPYHQYYICRYCWHKTRISNAFNAIYVDTVDTKHIHTFLPITFLIFNGFSIRKSFRMLRLRAFQPYHQYYICRYCQYKTHQHIPAHNFLNFQRIFNPQKVLECWDSELFNHTINTIYVDTVDTRQGSLMHSMLSMLTLSIQFSHLIVLCTRCCVRAMNTSVNSVNKHSFKCIACFDLHIDSVDKQDTLLNTQ